jgi:lysophospholipase L1-like esterase
MEAAMDRTGRQGARLAWRSYVAVGDSFTEGLDDPYPNGEQYRGWADLVATRLAKQVPDFRYANLAVRGRKLGPVINEQVPVALALAPELISFAAGGNDALRRSFDGPAVAAKLDNVVKLLRASGADLLLFGFARLNDRLPGRQLLRSRAELINRAVAEAAEEYGAYLVDLWSDEEFRSPLLWSVDRLHMNAYGHRRVAAHVLTMFGLTPEPSWWEPPSAAARSWTAARLDDARWAGTHLAPWVRRRLTGKSSGDNRVAKRPTLSPLI